MRPPADRAETRRLRHRASVLPLGYLGVVVATLIVGFGGGDDGLGFLWYLAATLPWSIGIGVLDWHGHATIALAGVGALANAGALYGVSWTFVKSRDKYRRQVRFYDK